MTSATSTPSISALRACSECGTAACYAGWDACPEAVAPTSSRSTPGILRRSYRTSTGTTLTTVDELKTHRGIDDIRCHLAEAQQFRNLYRMAALLLERNPGIDLSDPHFDPAAALGPSMGSS